MTRLELLAGQLDAEAADHERQAPQQIFVQGLEFWKLCLEAKRLVLANPLPTEVKKNYPSGSTVEVIKR